MELTTVWFGLIAVLWAGYFLLEGFDFGVGMLLPVLARGERERRLLINTIGPVWDGNEVWLLVAGGATFAAFPEWYASLFSGFYLPLLIILVALIGRGVAFEYRGKIDTDRWRRNWDRVIFCGSLVPAFLWGVAFANIVHGVPLDAGHHYTGNLFTLLNPYGLLGDLATLDLFTLHGTVFVALKTDGQIRRQARRLLLRGFLPVAGIAAAIRGREGWAFLGTAVAIALAVVTLFGNLWPDVLPSTTADAYSLTVDNASSTHYTLTVMTWVAAMF